MSAKIPNSSGNTNPLGNSLPGQWIIGPSGKGGNKQYSNVV